MNTEVLFKLSQYLLGDKAGKYIVTTEDGVYLGHYINKLDAIEHVDNLNELDKSDKKDLMSLSEIIAFANENTDTEDK